MVIIEFVDKDGQVTAPRMHSKLGALRFRTMGILPAT
jgi:hypothetical protein